MNAKETPIFRENISKISENAKTKLANDVTSSTCQSYSASQSEERKGIKAPPRELKGK